MKKERNPYYVIDACRRYMQKYENNLVAIKSTNKGKNFSICKLINGRNLSFKTTTTFDMQNLKYNLKKYTGSKINEDYFYMDKLKEIFLLDRKNFFTNNIAEDLEALIGEHVIIEIDSGNNHYFVYEGYLIQKEEGSKYSIKIIKNRKLTKEEKIFNIIDVNFVARIIDQETLDEIINKVDNMELVTNEEVQEYLYAMLNHTLSA